MKYQPSIVRKDGETIYQITPLTGRGGPGRGQGRHSTGRKRRQYYVTDDEDKKLREYLLNKLRDPSN